MDSSNMNNNMNNNGASNYTYNTDGTYTTNSNYNTNGTYTSPVIEKNNRWKGVIGALIGAILGGLVWTAIGCLGYISGWVSVLIFFLAQAGYKKLNGKEDTFGVVISVVFGLLIIIPATYASYGFSVFQALNEGAHSHFNYFDVLLDLPMYMNRYELWGQFATNLFMGYAFTVVFGVFALLGKRKK